MLLSVKKLLEFSIYTDLAYIYTYNLSPISGPLYAYYMYVDMLIRTIYVVIRTLQRVESV